MENFSHIETKTTGFSSPAVDYLEERIKIPGVEDSYFTFLFRIGPGINFPNLKEGDLVVVSREKIPEIGDVCLGVNVKKEFSLYRVGKGKPENHWGVVIKILRNGQTNRSC